MKTAEEFIEHFTEKKIDIYRIKNECFLLDKDQKEIIDIIQKEKKIMPKHAGTFLGKESKSRFAPSLALLELLSKLSKYSDKKAVINEKSSWLFLCGRDVFAKSVISSPESGLVLVQNGRDENLGLGKLEKGMIRIMNLMDRGDFLRRESK